MVLKVCFTDAAGRMHCLCMHGVYDTTTGGYDIDAFEDKPFKDIREQMVIVLETTRRLQANPIHGEDDTDEEKAYAGQELADAVDSWTLLIAAADEHPDARLIWV